MRRTAVLSAAVLLALFLTSNMALAGTIEKNTIFLSGSSMIDYKVLDYEGYADQTSEFELNVNIGYFIADNCEAGLMTRFDFTDEQAVNTSDLGIGPYFSYHFPFDPDFNFFILAGLGYVKYDTDYDEILSDLDADGYMITGKIGFEYFFRTNVAIIFGMVWQREELEINFGDISRDVTIWTYGPEVGIGIFF